MDFFYVVFDKVDLPFSIVDCKHKCHQNPQKNVNQVLHTCGSSASGSRSCSGSGGSGSSGGSVLNQKHDLLLADELKLYGTDHQSGSVVATAAKQKLHTNNSGSRVV